MLDPSKVIYGDRHLGVHNPHYTSIHCDTEDLIVENMAITAESLKCDGVGGKVEYDHWTDKSIKHPSEYARPTEEGILDSFLV